MFHLIFITRRLSWDNIWIILRFWCSLASWYHQLQSKDRFGVQKKLRILTENFIKLFLNGNLMEISISTQTEFESEHKKLVLAFKDANNLFLFTTQYAYTWLSEAQQLTVNKSPCCCCCQVPCSLALAHKMRQESQLAGRMHVHELSTRDPQSEPHEGR